MALDYDLEIATEIEPIQALRLINTELHLAWAEGTHLLGPGVVISAIYNSELGISVIEESFGFRPTISIGFRLLPHSNEYVEGKHIMIRATMEMLRHEKGDAVLIFNGSQILMQRSNNELLINEGWSEWTSYNLFANVDLPYTVRNLPSPL